MKSIPCSHKPGWSLRWISSKIGRLGRRKASLLCPCPHRPTQIRRSVCSMPIPWLTIRLKSMLPNHASNTHSKKHFASQHPSFHLEQGCFFSLQGHARFYSRYFILTTLPSNVF